MHNLYGKRKLLALEVKGGFELSNGMYCVFGKTPDEGVSVDVYDDKTMNLLVGMEHGIIGNMFGKTWDSEEVSLLKDFMESMKSEFEESMVYYYGPKTCTFEEFEITRPIPVKTGRFAK